MLWKSCRAKGKIPHLILKLAIFLTFDTQNATSFSLRGAFLYQKALPNALFFYRSLDESRSERPNFYCEMNFVRSPFSRALLMTRTKSHPASTRKTALSPVAIPRFDQEMAPSCSPSRIPSKI
jgi:hypothetical protein